MSATYQKKAPLMPNVQASTHSDLSIKRKPRPKRSYFDVGIGSVCLMGVPRHTHAREDESYLVLGGELEVIVGGKTFVLKPGDSFVGPRGIYHQLRNSGDVENHYLLIFWASGFEGFLEATAVPVPYNAVAPTNHLLLGMSMNSPANMEFFAVES